MANSKLVYNAHGKKYEVPRVLLSSLSELRKGDHIAFHRHSGAYWHHAIVEDIDRKNGKFCIIEYTNTGEEFDVQDLKNSARSCQSGSCCCPAIAKVERTPLTECRLKNGDVYVLKHDNCLDPEEVVRNARSRLKERKYWPFTNNCEHFAMWCKTGKSSSDQVNKATLMFLRQTVAQVCKETMEILLVAKDCLTAAPKHLEEILNSRLPKWLQEVSADFQLRELLLGVLKKLCKVFTDAASKVEFVKNGAQRLKEEIITHIVSGVKQILPSSVHELKVVNQTLAAIRHFEILNSALRQWFDKVFLNSALCKGLNDFLILVLSLLTGLKRKFMESGAREATKKLVTQAVSKVKQHFAKAVVCEGTEEILTQTAEEAMKSGIREGSEEVVTQAASKPTAGMVNSLVVGAVFSLLIEGGFVAYDIFCLHSDMEKGEITEEKFKTDAKKRVMTGTGNVAGSTLGATIGQVVFPVPILGGVLGGVIGGISGSYFANIAAKAVWK